MGCGGSGRRSGWGRWWANSKGGGPGPLGSGKLFRGILLSGRSRLFQYGGEGQNGTMRDLIVGCGYVGMAVGEALAKQGHKVVGLRRSAGGGDELKAVGIEPVVGDVTGAQSLAELAPGYDWVVNCVGASGGGV